MMARTLDPGPELDARVAVEVMGWSIVTVREWDHSGQGCWWEESGRYIAEGSWSPSTHIATAWEVVGRMRESGWCYIIEQDGPPEDRTVCCQLSLQHEGKDEGGDLVTVHADTAPLAICLAALIAKRRACDGA